MPEPDPTATSNRTAQTRRPRRGTAQGGFRADIQALRAIAVAGVVLYHLWPHRLPGGFVGVDVFFVISGYLITSHLLKRPPRTPREVAEFWARRVKRLLPASLLVLTVTALVSFKLAPVSTWQDTGKQIVASALYVQNWILSFDSVDYLAADNAPTAVQHFWSLSVEEQFYFFWPILIGLLALFVAKSRSRTKVTYLVGIGLVTGASLVYSIWMSIHEPAQAYFVTPVRLWELSAGGLVAVLFGEDARRRQGSSRHCAPGPACSELRRPLCSSKAQWRFPATLHSYLWCQRRSSSRRIRRRRFLPWV